MQLIAGLCLSRTHAIWRHCAEQMCWANVLSTAESITCQSYPSTLAFKLAAMQSSSMRSGQVHAVLPVNALVGAIQPFSLLAYDICPHTLYKYLFFPARKGLYSSGFSWTFHINSQLENLYENGEKWEDRQVQACEVFVYIDPQPSLVLWWPVQGIQCCWTASIIYSYKTLLSKFIRFSDLLVVQAEQVL